MYAIYADRVSDCGSFDCNRCSPDNLYIKANNAKIWGAVSVNNCNFKGVYNSDKCQDFTKRFGTEFCTWDSDAWPGSDDKLVCATPSASDFTDAKVRAITHWGGDGSKYTLMFEVKKGGGSSVSLIKNLVANSDEGTKSIGNSCLDWNYNNNRLYFNGNCHKQDNQQCFMTKSGEIKQKRDPKKCLDVPGHGQLYMYNCHGGSNQKWEVTAENQIVSRATGSFGGKCIDMSMGDAEVKPCDLRILKQRFDISDETSLCKKCDYGTSKVGGTTQKM